MPRYKARPFLLKEPKFYGLYLYTNFVHRTLSMFKYQQDLRQVIINYGYSMSFILIWHEIVEAIAKHEKENLGGKKKFAQVSLARSFLTKPTAQDTYIAMNQLVLHIAEELNKLDSHILKPFPFDRYSSKFCEYVF